MEIVGLKTLKEKMRVAAQSDISILIEGETGTGKEMMARFIHASSPRSAAPFVAVNCAALPESLIESELFGHVRGAYTGAIAERPGKFAAANNGTLLLDEIGEMDLHLQAKLLRVLQNGEYYPVGSDVLRRTTARVVATTNKNIKQLLQEGTFRNDLYYRLAVITFYIPPLRLHLKSLPALLHAYGVENVSPSDMERLRGYSWPGNVRELVNSIQYRNILGDWPPLLQEATTGGLKQDLLFKALSATTNRSEVAAMLGISRRTAYNLIRRHAPHLIKPKVKDGTAD